MSSVINHVFVYGTLKRGQIREHMWPHPPLQVIPAKIRGRLYDLGSYPGLWTGDDWVGGEVWQFAARHMPDTLAVVDQIEGYANSPQDLYERVIVDCLTDSGMIQAYAYRYQDSNIIKAAQVLPKFPGDVCTWP